ncbi:hypothetical protein [Clostridium manihotivorum]|uniref:Uncharacterized protein n=1 Tax=Clostridium manihotivorum TaxID=2320868 RepID=A0A3R5QWN2_9CLOT|nr:hypothetical protein [Clostridium manihotivorum]QAA31255.1 hypothetical protein C1I91_06120 [Clostridium manihotivorum]
MGKNTYYKKIELDEQLLFDSEIARKYKIYRYKNNKNEIKNSLNAKLVTVIIEEYIQENNIKCEELYYPTFSGIARVYPESVYKPAIEQFLEKQCANESNQYYKAKNGAKYKFTYSISDFTTI